MLFIILTTLLLAGIAFYQVVQGMFSAMVMTVLTLLAAAVAFNYYEPLAELLVSHLGAYAHPAALLGIFVITLYALREIYDRLIKGNVVMGMWPDRIGGAAFGVITGFLLVGVLMTVVLMLPLGASALAYEDYDSDLAEARGGAPRWACSFATGLMKHLSAGSLQPIGEGNSYARAHDDQQLEAFCVRNRPAGGSALAPPDALQVRGAYLLKIPEGRGAAEISPADRANIERIRDVTPDNPLLSRTERVGDTVIVAIRVAVDQNARDEQDDWWRLPATHFRLVTQAGRSFYPVGYITWSGGRWILNTVETEKKVARIGKIVVARAWREKGGPSKRIVDWIYRIPAKAKPQYVVFRRTAKAPIPLTLNYGLPGAYDKKGRQIALEVKPKRGRVELKGAAGRTFLDPEYAEVGDRMPSDLRIRFMPGQRPPEIQAVERAGAKLTRGRVVGSVSALVSAIPASTRGATRIIEFGRPSRNSLVVQVNCRINRSFPVDAALRASLPGMSPQLVLDNGQNIPHSGACLFYDSGERQVYFYYDASKLYGRFDPVFAQTLLAQMSNGRTLLLLFNVPRDSSRRIERLTLGQPRYEFYAEPPLACEGR